MALRPTRSRRTRVFNVFVGLFFFAVGLAMMASMVVARGDWTSEQMLEAIAPLALLLLFSVPGAIIYVRRGQH